MNQGMNRKQMLEKVGQIVKRRSIQWVVRKSHSYCCDYYFVGPRGADYNWLYIDEGYGKNLGELGIGNCCDLSINNLVPTGKDYALCAAAIRIFDEQIQKEINEFYKFVYNEKNLLKYTVDYDIKAGTYTLSLNQRPIFVLTPEKDGLYLNRPNHVRTHVSDVLVPMPLDIVLKRAAIPFCGK